MSRTFTGTNLIDMAKDLADHENSTVLSDAQWLVWLSSSYARYHAKLVQTGMGYVTGSQTITATGVSTYTLPSDFFATARVDRVDGSSYIPLEHISVLAREKFEGTGSGQAAAYMINGANIELLPAPSGGSYRHIYQPTVAKVTSAATTLYFDRGFEELLVFDMAIRARMKEEVSVSDLKAERDRLLGDLEEVLVLMYWGDSPSLVDRHEDPMLPGDYWPRRGML